MANDREEEDRRRRTRILAIVASIYTDGYEEGTERVSTEYDLSPKVIAGAAGRMESRLSARLDQIKDSLDGYEEAIERKAAELKADGVDGDRLLVEIQTFASALADKKADVISKVEHGTGRIEGAGETMNETGEEFEWRFPHFDLGSDHEECPICEAIREGSPYSADEAEENGFPEYPHPNCDHGWVLVPAGTESSTEENPVEPGWRRYRTGAPA